MAVKPRVLQFDVTVDRAGDARSALGGTPLPREAEWWAEHLVLAGLVRCTLTSLAYHAQLAGLELESSGEAEGVVSRRESDGRYAFTEIAVAIDVTVDPVPENVRELLANAERDCFVGASLTAKPRYRWTVNGEEIA